MPASADSPAAEDKGTRTLAALLVECPGWPLQEGDALRSQANVDKMAAGQPLDVAPEAQVAAALAWLGIDGEDVRCRPRRQRRAPAH